MARKRTRMTLRDWDIIDEALVALRSEIDEEYAEGKLGSAARYKQVRVTLEKVLDRVAACDA